MALARGSSGVSVLHQCVCRQFGWDITLLDVIGCVTVHPVFMWYC